MHIITTIQTENHLDFLFAEKAYLVTSLLSPLPHRVCPLNEIHWYIQHIPGKSDDIHEHLGPQLEGLKVTALVITI